MSKFAQESWVTSAKNDVQAFQAWCLAISLKASYTSRKLTVIISKSVSPEFGSILRQEFDLVIDEPTREQVQAICGVHAWKREMSDGDRAKFWAWTLIIWNKCVYIPSNALVLDNCDNIFELEHISIATNDAGDIYTLKPELKTFMLILLAWNQLDPDQASVENTLRSCFQDLQSIPDFILDNCFCAAGEPDGKCDRMEPPKLLTYVAGLLSSAMNCQHWLEFNDHRVLPRMLALDSDSLKMYLTDFVSKHGLHVPKLPPLDTVPLQDNMDKILKNSIAVIGMSCRFADSDNINEFWQALAEGRDCIHPMSDARQQLHFSNPNLHKFEGGFLKCAVDQFDAQFFGISPREAPFIDPQQRLLLEVIWEALEHAGIPPNTLRDTMTGCFTGIYQNHYDSYIGFEGHTFFETYYRFLGNIFSCTSSRISYFLGLLGRNLAFDSACSSSPAALHSACEALCRGEIPLAIVSGVNVLLDLREELATPDMRTRAKDYRCKTFDASADGYVRAEGCGCVILKRTADALRDGDNILALIRGSAINNDGGAGRSFGRPNAASQELVFRQALKNAGVEAKEVSYLEAHGTGTAVGDPIEMQTVSRVYSEGRDPSRPLHIASVKTNIGHTESASGMAALIKIILSLQNRKIPPHLNLKNLNPRIDMDSIPAIVPQNLTDWIPPPTKEGQGDGQCGPRLAAANTFSLSGMNAHIILEEPPAWASVKNKTPMKEMEVETIAPPPLLITISAKTQESLQGIVAKYLTFFMENPAVPLADIAYTTNVCRAHNFPYRAALTAVDVTGAANCLRNQDYLTGRGAGTKPKIGFLFTGQGCQYVGMARNLHQMSPAFASPFEKCSRLLQSLIGTNLADIIWSDETKLQNTLFCQPAIFCVQYCLLKHWAALGVYPDCVLGHSVGEFAAAVAAGLLTLEQAMRLVVERSRLVSTLPESSMLVLKCNHEKVKELINSFQEDNTNTGQWFVKTFLASDTSSGCWLDVAAVNSETEVVVSGTTETIKGFETYCNKKEVKTQKLASSHAFHSRAVDSILPAYESAVRNILGSSNPVKNQKLNCVNCVYISGRKAVVMNSDQLLSPAYWIEHLRHTVQFSDAIQLIGANITSTDSGSSNIDDLKCDILIELGPQPILLGLAMSNLQGKRSSDGEELLYCPSLRRGKKGNARSADWDNMMHELARLYVAGVNLDWSRWYAPMKGAVQRVASLPTYVFDRQTYWVNRKKDDRKVEEVLHAGSAHSSNFTPSNTKPCHPLLGHRFPSPLTETVYCQSLSTQTLPYAVDHKIGGKVILPGAVFLEAALAVGRELMGPTCGNIAVPLVVQNLSIEKALVVDAANSTQLQTIVALVKPDEEGKTSEEFQYDISFHRSLVPDQQHDSWKRHAKATFHPTSSFSAAVKSEQQLYEDMLNIDQLKPQLLNHTNESIKSVYESLAVKGLEFGSAFQSITAMWTGDNDILTMVRITQPAPETKLVEEGASDYVCHPIVIDAMFQTLIFRSMILNKGMKNNDASLLQLPLNVRKFTWLGRAAAGASTTLYVYSGSESTICLYDETGSILAVLEGMEFIKVSVESFLRTIRAEYVHTPDFYQENWVQSVGVTQNRHQDLSLVLQNVTNCSGRTVEKLNEYVSCRALEKEALGQINLMCVYHVIWSIQECGWPWPTVTGGTIPYDLWEQCLCEQLKDTRVHISFMAALAKEGYVQLGQDQHCVLRPLPSIAKCQEEIQKLQEQICAHDAQAVDMRLFEFSTYCSQHLTPILKCETTALSVLFPGDESKIGASRFHNETNYIQKIADVFLASLKDMVANLCTSTSASSSSDENVLRILEVGAGSGAMSGKIIKFLQEAGIKYTYTFTDISPQFLTKAEDQFGTTNMHYQIFNIERDPLSQGFCTNNYDIVLALEVLHATANLEETLQNLQLLMRPQGVIMVSEQMETPLFYNVSFALLPGWWRFNDFRTNSPLVSSMEWTKVLGRCGFEHVNVIQSQEDDAMGIAFGRAPSTPNPHSTPTRSWILFGSKSILGQKIGTRLQLAGRNVIHVMSETGVSQLQHVSHGEYSLDFESAAQFQQVFEAIQNEGGSHTEVAVEGVLYLCLDEDMNGIVENQRFKMSGLLHLMQNLTLRPFTTTTSGNNSKLKVVVVTEGVHYVGDQSLGNPGNATAWGSFRAFMNECQDANCCVIDVVGLGPNAEKRQVHNLHSANGTGDKVADEICSHFWIMGNEKSVLIRDDGRKYVHRLIPTDNPVPPLPLPIYTDRYAFINPPSGSFSDIQIGLDTSTGWLSMSSSPSGGQYIQVAVGAVGLNFRDLLCVLKPPGFEFNVKPSANGGYDVGADISGVVVAVGDHVTKYRVGDQVFGRTTTGGIKSHTIVHESMLMHKPATMTFTGAATLPIVFLTSYHCLVALGRLKAEDRLLIHVGTGGVGLSAIQIAKEIGCTIFATAGSKRKRTCLRQHLGLTHVYSSRTLEYSAAIMRDTNGAGVTMVLNSLTSPGFKEATLECCSKEAQFIEIGRLNIWTADEVASLRPDVRYKVFDLSLVDDEGLELIQKTWNELGRKFETGTYKPLPFTVFSLERLHEAFHHFQEAKHIGKIVIKMPQVERATNGRLVLKHNLFDPESTYLITGGLGGIGVEVTRWMSGTGAKHIVLAGRNPPGTQLKTYLDQLSERSGCQIVTFASDIGDHSQCFALLGNIKKAGLPPLRGIFHGALVLEDALVQDQSWEKFNTVFHPKVYSTWWLHKLTLDYDLEFFTMFSSVAALGCTVGQTPYAAASRFMDSLAHYRVAMGLPGATVNWGAWADVGAATFRKLGHDAFFGIHAFSPSHGINALEKFMLQNYTQAFVAEVPDWEVVKRFTNLGSFLDKLQSVKNDGDVGRTDTSAQSVQLAEIKNCAAGEREGKIQAYLQGTLKRTLRLPPSDTITLDQNFTEIGVDSLMTMELRNKLQILFEGTNRTLSINAVLENPTLRSLSAYLANVLNSDHRTS